MRYLRALAAFAALLLLLAGLPVGLLRLAGPPWPQLPETRDQLEVWLSQPITQQRVLWLLALVAWLLWLWLVYSVAADVTARLTAVFAPARLRRLRRRLRVAGPVQALVGGLIGAVVVGLTSGPAHASPTTNPVPPPQPTGPASPTAAQPSHPAYPGPRHAPPTESAEQTVPADGVTLPNGGGWIAPAVAEAIAATVTLLWLHRRRRYRPGAPQRTDRTDPDLVPPPPTAQIVLAARLRTDPPPPDDVPPDVPVQAVTALHLADLPRQLVVTGPGASDALRGLLATVLLGARPAGTVTITSTGLELLLHPYPPPDSIPGLIISAVHQPSRQQPSLAITSNFRTHSVIAETVPATDLSDLERTVWHIATSGMVSTTAPSTTDTADQVRTVGRLTVLGAAPLTDLLALLKTTHTTGGIGDTTKHRSPTTPVPAASSVAERTSATGHRLTVTLFGPITVTPTAATKPIRLSRAAAVQLLAYLAVHRDGATTDQIRHDLWPGVPTESARHRVHSTVSSLRTTLGPAADGADVIIREHDRYRLDPKHVDTDLWQFDDAVNRAATAIDPNTRRTALHAIAHYHAELADTAPWPWLTLTRETRRRHVIDALAALAETEPDPHDQLRWLQQAIQLDPINETLYQQAIRAHAAAGNTDAIHHLLDSLTRQLATIDRRPDPATLDLVQQAKQQLSKS